MEARDRPQAVVMSSSSQSSSSVEVQVGEVHPGVVEALCRRTMRPMMRPTDMNTSRGAEDGIEAADDLVDGDYGRRGCEVGKIATIQ